MFYDIVEPTAGTTAISTGGTDSGGDAGAASESGRQNGGASQGGEPRPIGGRAGQDGAKPQSGAGGNTPQGGTPPVGGNSGTNSGGHGGSGTALPPVCGRINDLEGRVLQVRQAYARLVYNDCRVGRMLREVEDLSAFYNLFSRWSAWLWGCAGAQKEVEFGIAIDDEELTRADADVLIEHYLTAATPALMLTADERARMKVQLEEAASRAGVDPSTETFSLSVCAPMGEGGAGGVGGQGGAAGAANAGSGGEISAGGTGG